MTNRRYYTIIFLIICILIAGISCRRPIDMAFMEKLARMQNPQYRSRPVEQKTILELQGIIEKCRQDVSRYADTAGTLTSMYKNIGLKYLDIGYYEQMITQYTGQLSIEKKMATDNEQVVYEQSLALILLQRGMYLKAYESFIKALEISQTSEVLYYYAGLCAGNVAKTMSIEDSMKGFDWFEKAERYYKRAIDFDSYYIEALYGLSVILVYELDRPDEALEYLLRIKEKEKSNIDALFVLATAYFQLEKYQEAVIEYKVIEQASKLEEVKKQARLNREKIEKLYLNSGQ